MLLIGLDGLEISTLNRSAVLSPRSNRERLSSVGVAVNNSSVFIKSVALDDFNKALDTTSNKKSDNGLVVLTNFLIADRRVGLLIT